MTEAPTSISVDQRLDLEQAAQHILDGDLIAYPTETFLGLGVNADDPAAIDRLRALKSRGDKPISVIVATVEMLERWVAPLDAPALALIEAFWPGPLTLVARATAAVPAALRGGGATIGVRVSGHPVARALSARIGGPITSTSCNRVGGREPTRPDQIEPEVRRVIAGYIDGRTPGGRASTIVDVSDGAPAVLRAGVLPIARLRAVVPEISALGCEGS